MPKGKKNMHYTLDYWNELIKEWENSEESARAFCRKKNIQASAFYKWKKQVNQISRPDINQKEEKWRFIVEGWMQSELTPLEYCKKNNINIFGFKAWKKQLDLDHAEENKWKSILEEWKDSGKSIQQFSEDKGIGYFGLSKWKKKLYPEDSIRDRSKQKEQWEIVAREWKKSGLNQKVVCKKFGITSNTFRRWQHQFNPKDVKKCAKRKPAQDRKDIIEDWKKSELSVSEYCEHKGIGVAAFRAWHYKLGDLSGKKTLKKRTPDEWKFIIQDWDKSGLSRVDYCKQKGICLSIFRRWMKTLQKSGEIIFASETSFINVPRTASAKRKNCVIIYNSGKRIRKKTGRDPVQIMKWEKIIEEWRGSELSKAVFCKDKKILYNSFLYWERHFYPQERTNITPEENREKWIARIKDWKDSGLTIKAYCEKNIIHIPRFFVWRKKLAKHLPKDITVRKNREEWKEIVEDWHKSGLPLATYSRRKGVGPASLKKWVDRFKKQAYLENQRHLILNKHAEEERHQNTGASRKFSMNPEMKIFSNQSNSTKQKVEIQFAQGHHLFLEGQLDLKKIIPWLVSLLKK